MYKIFIDYSKRFVIDSHLKCYSLLYSIDHITAACLLLGAWLFNKVNIKDNLVSEGAYGSRE